MALVKGGDTNHMAETISPVGQSGFRWGCNGLYWGRFRPNWQNGVTKAPETIRAESTTDLLPDLEVSEDYNLL